MYLPMVVVVFYIFWLLRKYIIIEGDHEFTNASKLNCFISHKGIYMHLKKCNSTHTSIGYLITVYRQRWILFPLQ